MARFCPAPFLALLILAPPAAQAADARPPLPAGISALLASDYPERQWGAPPEATSPEGAIWVDAAKTEHAAKTNGDRNLDPALNAYVAQVVARVAGPFAGDIRTYVMDRPLFNATMYPNGYTEVWSSVLLRCQTEDQLAYVVGHEAGHFRHSHTYRRSRERKNGDNAVLATQLIIAAIGISAMNNTDSYYTMRDIAQATRDLMDISYLAIWASVMSYSREAESQADAWGLIYAREAGYFTGDGAGIWQSLLDEVQHSDFEARRRNGAMFNILSSHPMNEDRVVALREQDKAMNGGTASTRSAEAAKAARKAYRDHIRPYLSSWLEDDLKLRDYGQTLYVLEQLLIDDDDAGVLNYYKGEAYRRRAKGDDLNQALAAYRTALGYRDAPKQTYRQMGEIHRRNGDTPEAIEAFELYVAQAPDAEDAWMIQDQIETLKKSSGNGEPATTADEADTRGL